MLYLKLNGLNLFSCYKTQIYFPFITSNTIFFMVLTNIMSLWELKLRFYKQI